MKDTEQLNETQNIVNVVISILAICCHGNSVYYGYSQILYYQLNIFIVCKI